MSRQTRCSPEAREWSMESLHNPVSMVRKPRLAPGRGRRLAGEEQQRLLEKAEYPMRELITRVPDGVYRFDDRLDDYGLGTDTIEVRVDVIVDGGSIEVDFSRSSDQVPAALNSYLGFGGYGARADSDGPEALAPVVSCRNIPVEVHETNNPVRIRRLELIPDSGGAGRFRGGCGLRNDVELRARDATMTLLGDRHANAPYGLFGARPGEKARTLLVRGGETRALGSKEVVRPARGDVVSFRLAGAGGYGDPRDRDREALLRDVADGLVTPGVARQIHGIDPDTTT